jgi:hypothetical protein
VAKVIVAAMAVLLALTSCAKEPQTPTEELRSAIKQTLTTESYSVTITSKSFGQTFSAFVAEHDGKLGRVRKGSEVQGVFIGKTVYVAVSEDPGTFMRCGDRQENGTRRTFDSYSPLLRKAAARKGAKKRGKVYVFDAFARSDDGRTEARFTLKGGRVETLTLTTFPTGANVSPPSTYVFRFSYKEVPEVTAPPDEAIIDCRPSVGN